MKLIDYSSISTILIDVDGTLTDGKISFDSDGKSSLGFSISDGYGLKILSQNNLNLIILSGSYSKAITHRMRGLGLRKNNINIGISNKYNFINIMIEKKLLIPDHTLYIGDDLNDLDAMLLVKFKACPQNAHIRVKNVSNYVSTRIGGDGAVREILEYFFPRFF